MYLLSKNMTNNPEWTPSLITRIVKNSSLRGTPEFGCRLLIIWFFQEVSVWKSKSRSEYQDWVHSAQGQVEICLGFLLHTIEQKKLLHKDQDRLWSLVLLSCLFFISKHFAGDQSTLNLVLHFLARLKETLTHEDVRAIAFLVSVFFGNKYFAGFKAFLSQFERKLKTYLGSLPVFEVARHLRRSSSRSRSARKLGKTKTLVFKDDTKLCAYKLKTKQNNTTLK